MRAVGHLFLDIARSWFLASLVLSVWLLLFAAIAPLHQALFNPIPADGPVSTSERVALDESITSYLVSGNTDELTSFTETERGHMDDVRTILIGVLIKVIFSIILLLVIRIDAHSSRGALALIAMLALVSALMFDGVFVGMHELLFVGTDWLLPPDQFVLTQIYPRDFFAVAWGGILALTLVSLGIVHASLRQKA